MRRLAAVDWLLIGISLPIFLFGVVMSVVHGFRGDLVCLPFFVSSAPDAQLYPIVRRILSPLSAEAGPLGVGDRLLSLEESDLRGVSAAGFLVRWSGAAKTGGTSLLVTTERGDVRSDVRVPLVPGWRNVPGVPWWVGLPSQLSVVGTALLLLVRAAHWHLARRFYVASLLFVLTGTPYFYTPTLPWGRIIQGVLVLPLAYGLVLWTCFEFIPGLGLWSPWQRALAWTLGLLASTSNAAGFWLADAGPAAVLMRVGNLPLAGFVVAWLVALTLVYRRSDPLGRRQIKWVVYGFYVGALPWAVYLAASSLGVLPDRMRALVTVAGIAWVAFPSSASHQSRASSARAGSGASSALNARPSRFAAGDTSSRAKARRPAAPR